jgi:hypothetical protein
MPFLFQFACNIKSSSRYQPKSDIFYFGNATEIIDCQAKISNNNLLLNVMALPLDDMRLSFISV